jgi:hypothetical protein
MEQAKINTLRGREMTPEQKIKYEVLRKAYEWGAEELPALTGLNIDEIFDEYDEDSITDAMNEIRPGEFDTSGDIASCGSRHYESSSVAMQVFDGSYVGWTYWYGGGKHAEPEAIDWMSEAYDLKCKIEEKTVVVRTFTAI